MSWSLSSDGDRQRDKYNRGDKCPLDQVLGAAAQSPAPNLVLQGEESGQERLPGRELGEVRTGGKFSDTQAGETWEGEAGLAVKTDSSMRPSKPRKEEGFPESRGPLTAHPSLPFCSTSHSARHPRPQIEEEMVFQVSFLALELDSLHL